METCGFSDADDHKIAGLTSVIHPLEQDNLQQKGNFNKSPIGWKH